MKTELLKIAQDLEQGTITENQSQILWVYWTLSFRCLEFRKEEVL